MSRSEEPWESNQRTADCASPPQVQGPAQKRYRAPHLTIYGRLAELTRFGGSQFIDSGGFGNQP